MEEVCELIAAFWTMEAEKFDSQGAKMKTSQSSMIKFKSMRANVIKKNLKFWKEAKEDMDRYVTAMSVINNSFNFVTDATPPTSKSVRFEAIDLTLTLPRSVKELTTC